MFLLVLALIVTTVLTHYEGLRVLGRLAERRNGPPRRSMLIVIFGILLIHIVEIAVYGGAYWFSVDVAHLGKFGGAHASTVRDYFYFSAEAYSTLGLGDIYPLSDLRLIASVEPLNGMILIGWSSSFTYLKMRRFWRLHN